MDPEHARDLLAQERTRIEQALAELVPAPDEELSHADQHLGDSDLYETERDQGRIEQLRDDLAAIERAEKRLHDGTYGVSVESGEPIPDARLEIVPQAERTVEEQARLGG